MELMYRLLESTINLVRNDTLPSKLIVQNLPADWTHDHLRNFLEVEASTFTIMDNGVHTVKGIEHTALISLESNISDESLNEAKKHLQLCPFLGHTLKLEKLTSFSPGFYLIQHDFQHPEEAIHGLQDCFEDTSLNYWQRTTWIVAYQCDVESYFVLGYAILHIRTSAGKAVTIREGSSSKAHIQHVEPWYEQFHRPLLQEMLVLAKTGMQNELMMTKEQMTELKQKIKDMEVAEDERLEKTKTKALKRMERQAEMLRKELQTKSAKMTTIDVPAHKLPLLTDFATTWEGCQIMLLEDKNQALLFGTDQERREAEVALRENIAKMTEYPLRVETEMMEVLGTTKGRKYLTDFLRGHPKCSAVLDNSTILCAAMDEDDLQNLLGSLVGAFFNIRCRISRNLTSKMSFEVEKKKLQELYLVKIVLAPDGSYEVVIHGVAEDAVLAAKKVDTFAYLNNQGHTQFHIPGAMEAEACKKWFSKSLEEAKHMIVENGNGTIKTEELTREGYTLTFKCCQEVLGKVVRMLNDIKYGIVSTRIDLNETFQNNDRALVVNGLLSTGKGDFCSGILSTGKDAFCLGMVHKLEKGNLPCLLDIIVPGKHNLPEFGYASSCQGKAGIKTEEQQSSVPRRSSYRAERVFGHQSEEKQGASPTSKKSTSSSDYDTEDGLSLDDQDGETEGETRKFDFEVRVCTTASEDCSQEVVEMVIKELKFTFLWHETIRDLETFMQLDEATRQGIMKKASEKNVLLSKTDRGLQLCGIRVHVLQLQSRIQKIMYEFVDKKSKEGWAKRKLCGLPVDTDHIPGYWEEGKNKSTFETAIQNWTQTGTHLVPVTDEEYEAVEKVFKGTWEGDKVTFGKDSRLAAHDVEVVKVERLENPRMWRSYSHKREQLFNDLVEHHNGQPPASCTEVEDLVGSTGPVKTTLNIDKQGPLAREMYPQINEHYIFHGTSTEVLPKILSQGLDFRLSGNAMLGRGIYCAESSTKSNQYVDPKENRTYDREFSMLLMRILLGEPYVHTNAKPEQFARPPCRNCQKPKCLCDDSRQYNSVIDDATLNRIRIFREFTVYDQDVCYPEYVITYRRVLE